MRGRVGALVPDTSRASRGSRTGIDDRACLIEGPQRPTMDASATEIRINQREGREPAMTPRSHPTLTPLQVAAAKRHLNARIEAMSVEEALALYRDPAAMQALASEANLAAALEDADIDQLMAASNSVDEARDGPLFTDAEWPLIFATPGTQRLATDPAERARFEHQMRKDPKAVQALKRAMADVQSDRDSSLSPMAKQWIWRIAIGLVVGLVVIALNQG